MPIDEKPSRNEDEYFLRRDAEWLKERRALLDAERQNRESSEPRSAAEGAPSGMQCPRCDATLVARSFHHVMIDVCPKCNGVWLDRGELEMLGAVSSAEYAGLVNSLGRA